MVAKCCIVCHVLHAVGIFFVLGTRVVCQQIVLFHRPAQMSCLKELCMNHSTFDGNEHSGHLSLLNQWNKFHPILHTPSFLFQTPFPYFYLFPLSTFHIFRDSA